MFERRRLAPRSGGEKGRHPGTLLPDGLGGTPSADADAKPAVHPDAVVGVVFAGIAALFGYLSLRLPSSAALYPRIVLVALGALSLALVARGLTHSRFSGTGGSKRAKPTGAVSFTLVVLTSLAYVAAFEFIDFRVALFAFFLVSMRLWGLRWPWWKQLALVVGLTAAIYYSFAVFFSVPLP